MIEGPRRALAPALEREAAPHAPERVVRPSFRALAGAATPLTGDEAAGCLARAWQSTFGEPPAISTLELLWAQWALETAHGRAMRGHNFAGIKARRGGAFYETTEGSGASRKRVLGRFRTYATADDGARDHVALVARRYPLALEALRRGDGAGFVAELAHGGWFTGDPEAYRRGIEHLANERAGRVTQPQAPSARGALEAERFVDGVLSSLRLRERT